MKKYTKCPRTGAVTLYEHRIYIPGVESYRVWSACYAVACILCKIVIDHVHRIPFSGPLGALTFLKYANVVICHLTMGHQPRGTSRGLPHDSVCLIPRGLI